jgi:hypothetical protein
MKLQEFVSRTLVEIIDGVISAQNQTSSRNAIVNPNLRLVDGQTIVWRTYSNHDAIFVDFDIAVTVQEGTETKEGVGVAAALFVLGSQGKSDASHGVVSRIKFQIPIVLPVGKDLPQSQIEPRDFTG